MPQRAIALTFHSHLRELISCRRSALARLRMPARDEAQTRRGSPCNAFRDPAGSDNRVEPSARSADLRPPQVARSEPGRDGTARPTGRPPSPASIRWTRAYRRDTGSGTRRVEGCKESRTRRHTQSGRRRGGSGCPRDCRARTSERRSSQRFRIRSAPLPRQHAHAPPIGEGRLPGGHTRRRAPRRSSGTRPPAHMQTRGFPEWTDTVLAHEQAERGHCGTRTRRRMHRCAADGERHNYGPYRRSL